MHMILNYATLFSQHIPSTGHYDLREPTYEYDGFLSHKQTVGIVVPAGLETEYLKLPSQSQTNVEQRIEQLAIALALP